MMGKFGLSRVHEAYIYSDAMRCTNQMNDDEKHIPSQSISPDFKFKLSSRVKLWPSVSAFKLLRFLPPVVWVRVRYKKPNAAPNAAKIPNKACSTGMPSGQ